MSSMGNSAWTMCIVSAVATVVQLSTKNGDLHPVQITLLHAVVPLSERLVIPLHVLATKSSLCSRLTQGRRPERQLQVCSPRASQCHRRRLWILLLNLQGESNMGVAACQARSNMVCVSSTVMPPEACTACDRTYDTKIFDEGTACPEHMRKLGDMQ